MNAEKNKLRPIWFDRDLKLARVIDQRKLPHELTDLALDSADRIIYIIREMVVRGAPLIGATGAFGPYTLLFLDGSGTMDSDTLIAQCRRIKDARPTAVNLAWGVDRVLEKVLECDARETRLKMALSEALAIVEEEAENCRRIGIHGAGIIEKIRRKKQGQTVNILTHCNAGWLATVDHGTATAPMYAAFDNGIDLHIWVDETRPLNQGARLTTWELGRHGIPHTLITDNAGGHLMQHGKVDLVLVGTDRTTRAGDVANKIGTYLKALAARDNEIPFYVALPSSTFDWQVTDGLAGIPIEDRDPDEVHWINGITPEGQTTRVRISPADSPAANPAFDVTPARLVTGFITERGICGASEADIRALFSDKLNPEP